MLVKDAMHARAITANLHESLPDAVVKMEVFKVKRLPVLQDGQLVGLLTDGEVKRHLPALHEGLTPWEFTVRAGSVKVRDAMIRPVLTTLPDEPLDRAIRVMLDRRIGGLPVLSEEGQLLGMLTLTDVLRAEVRAPRLQWGTVGGHMTRTTISTPASAPASEAAAKLRITGLKVLPVLEGERLVGVLHERDLSVAIEKAQAAHGETMLSAQFFLKGKTARDLMRLPGGYVLPNAPMHSTLVKMLEADIHGLPVVNEDGELLGVITISDVLRTLLGDGEKEAAEQV